VRFLTTEFGLTSGWYHFLLTAFKWLIVVLLYFTMISFIYHFGPATQKKWEFITPGSSLATLLSIVSTLAFGYFVNNFGAYNQVYGSLGALIVFMLLMNINALVLLVGFELNNSIDMNKRLKLDSQDEDE
jgi:membrane protein